MLRVNGELVHPDLIEETFSRIKAAAEQETQGSCCERDPEFREQAENEVADSILIAQEAEKRHPEIPEEEVKPQLKELIDKYREHGASWEMLEAERDNMRYEISASLRMEKLIDELLGDDDQVTPDEVQAFYEEFEKDYRIAAESRCLHMMKPIAEHKSLPDLYQKMCEIREEALVEGADFIEIAKRETEKSTNEIDLDWIDLDRPTNPFESILFSLREGEVSPVMTYEHAFHIIKVTGIKPGHVTPLEEVQKEVEDRALARKKRKALQVLADTLRQEAEIERVSEEDAQG
ncbi:peptidyl-prolyl cis-trans isomerase [Akkermansiaceae bacterium]|nr:peptidyl-prolyl cis-trans isomerase [Akkermansiaceae bacterium]MDB4286468.1 peptidyl-prolyl cis-trans isomerase [bacterium]MDA7629859.1 peptidyl-prolyl cis-trans isomerase [Akkermansiaceae bacterium]MDA7864353.1 peptidyl-prolyl cis-trans isomerase [Akkermansiaceae bacterium]MDA7877010.1 peptidyl-prolyl cis-trans isomerase [Akkermansiaceae bacterium]